MRVIHKKELGCQATTPVVIKEEVRDSVGTAKTEKFWQLLGGKKGVKCEEGGREGGKEGGRERGREERGREGGREGGRK